MTRDRKGTTCRERTRDIEPERQKNLVQTVQEKSDAWLWEETNRERFSLDDREMEKKAGFDLVVKHRLKGARPRRVGSIHW